MTDPPEAVEAEHRCRRCRTAMERPDGAAMIATPGAAVTEGYVCDECLELLATRPREFWDVGWDEKEKDVSLPSVGQVWNRAGTSWKILRAQSDGEVQVLEYPYTIGQKPLTVDWTEFCKTSTRLETDEGGARPAPPAPLVPWEGCKVQLTCGGPVMTVEVVRRDGQRDQRPYAVEVCYVPEYGTEGRIIRDTFRITSVVVVQVTDPATNGHGVVDANAEAPRAAPQ